MFQVSEIVLRLLEDEWLDVRIKASQVLSGLLHCDFVHDTKELMVSVIKYLNKEWNSFYVASHYIFFSGNIQSKV